MSVFTAELLTDKIIKSTDKQLKEMLVKIVRIPMAEASYTRMARIIMGLQDSQASRVVVPVERRMIPLREIEKLSESGLLDYAETFLEIALNEGGPYQSSDILLLAAAEIDHPFYVKPEGISRKYMVQIGYLLSMAGLVRKSHYDPGHTHPVKAWKPVRGATKYTVKQRLELLHSYIRQSTNEAVRLKPFQNAPASLKDII